MEDSSLDLVEWEERMRVPWRPLALAAAMFVVAAAGPAAAQTVYVAKAPPGAALELALNTTTVQTAKADDKGVAPMPLPLPAGKTEIDVRVFVDVCEQARKVTLVESGWQPAPMGAGCIRHELFGVFELHESTSLVVDAAEQSQAVWIRQGKPPASWLDPNVEPEHESGGFEWPTATGLVIFGGAGVSTLGNFGGIACGTQVECSEASVRLTFRAGAEFWLGKYLAASGSYLKPLKAEAVGTGTGFTYTTAQITDIVTFTGKVGLPFGRVRLWVEAGGIYSRATMVTDQLVDSITITVDDTTTTFPGGAHRTLLQTAGFGWIAGGGGEVWLTKKFAIYGEFTRASVKGSPRAGGEGQIDDALTSVIAGVKLHLGR
jgi:hypothetical protein